MSAIAAAESSEFRLIYCPYPTLETAQKIAEKSVTLNLAACTNIFPNMQSYYNWEGQLEASHEVLVLFKTNTEKSDELIKFLEKEHPYNVPCIITFEPKDINSAYSNWVNESLLK